MVTMELNKLNKYYAHNHANAADTKAVRLISDVM